MLDVFSKTSTHVRFLQVGANDGFFHDPLFKFIKMYGWRGVLLEPQPYVYNHYLKKLHRKTPGVFTVNAALSDSDGKKTIYKISFSNARWATGLTSFNRQVLEEAIDSGHVQRCADRYGEKLPDSRIDFITEQPVQSITPGTLIQQYHLETIDWLQIDAEGYDFEIIKLMEINKTRPHVIAFEHSHLSTADRKACMEHLRANGYRIRDMRENTVAMRNPLGELARFFGPTSD